MHSPEPGHYNIFAAVAATSAGNAMAVGQYWFGTGPSLEEESLVGHWNGTKWEHLPGSPGIQFWWLAATSRGNAWAVGDGLVIEHWNGHTWSQLPISGPGILTGAAATSPAGIWAVGGGAQSVAIHCS